MLVAAASTKGGCGKTTLAVHLACAWSRRHRVLLVDADPQRSALAWLQDRHDGQLELQPAPRSGLHPFLESQAGYHDVVLIDTPPGITGPLREVIRAAGLLLVPLQPTPIDVLAVHATLELAQILRGSTLDVRLVLSRVRPGTILARTIREALEPYGAPILRQSLGERVAVAEASGTGRPVFDVAPDSIAAAEFLGVARELGQEVFRHGEHDQDKGAVRA
jgi:chromosome partitioning protein